MSGFIVSILYLNKTKDKIVYEQFFNVNKC